MTHAEELRKMTDEELLNELLRLMENAVACPTCFRNHGKERLKLWLETRVNE